MSALKTCQRCGHLTAHRCGANLKTCELDYCHCGSGKVKAPCPNCWHWTLDLVADRGECRVDGCSCHCLLNADRLALKAREMPVSPDGLETLAVRKDRVLEAAAGCPDVKRALLKLFPEAFKEVAKPRPMKTTQADLTAMDKGRVFRVGSGLAYALCVAKTSGPGYRLAAVYGADPGNWWSGNEEPLTQVALSPREFFQKLERGEL